MIQPTTARPESPTRGEGSLLTPRFARERAKPGNIYPPPLGNRGTAPSRLSKTRRNFNFQAKGDAFSHRAAGATVLILGEPSAPASWPDQLRLQTDVILASPLPGATSGQSEFPLGAETR